MNSYPLLRAPPFTPSVLLAPQQSATAAPKMSAFFRLLYRHSNSATYSGKYLADLVKAAHDPALQQRPEAVNGLRVDQPRRTRLAVPHEIVVVVGCQPEVAACAHRWRGGSPCRTQLADEAPSNVSCWPRDDASDNRCLCVRRRRSRFPSRTPPGPTMRLSQWLFLFLPPMYVSSTSTMPISLRKSGSTSAARMRWHI